MWKAKMLLRAGVQQQGEKVSVWHWGKLEFTCGAKVVFGSVSCTSVVGSHGLGSLPFPTLWPRQGWLNALTCRTDRQRWVGEFLLRGSLTLPDLACWWDNPCSHHSSQPQRLQWPRDSGSKTSVPVPGWHLVPCWAGTPPVRQGAAAGRAARGRGGKTGLPQK